MSILKIPTARVFEPLLARARYKGVHGGRGSGKSHFFGELLAETTKQYREMLNRRAVKEWTATSAQVCSDERPHRLNERSE